MAFSTGGFQVHHGDEAPPHGGGPLADAGSQGGVDLDTEKNTTGAGPGDLADNGAGQGDGGAPGGPPAGHHGQNDAGDGDKGGPGFMPNGENGLMQLASFLQSLGNDGQGEGGGLGWGQGGEGGSQGIAGDQAGQGSGAPGGPGGGGGYGSLGGGGTGGGGGGGTGGGPSQDPHDGGNTGGGDTGGGGTGGPNGGGDGGQNPLIGGDTGPIGDGCVIGICAPNGDTPPGGKPDQPGGPNIFAPLGGSSFDGPQTDFVSDLSINGDGPVEGGPVPEPSAWLLMILGFGALGQALRTRRARALA